MTDLLTVTFMVLSGLSFRQVSRRVCLLLGFCLALVPVVRAQSSTWADSLPEAYLPELKALLETAMKQSPEMLIRQAEIDRAEARVWMEGYQRFPAVGGDIRYDSNQTAVSSNENTKSRDSGLFYSTSINQELFHWGEIRNRTKSAELAVAITQRDFAEAYRVLAVNLRQSYLSLVAQNARLRQARFNLGLREKEFEATRERLARGAASTGDLVAQELGLSELQLAVERLQAEFDSQRRRIGRMAGIAELAVEKIPVAIPEPRYDAQAANELLAALLRDGGKSTFQAQVAELNVRQADLKYRIARVRLLPKFNASLGHSRESSTTASPDRVSQTAITRDTLEVRGNWSIFDGFATKGAKLEAKAERRLWERRLQAVSDAAMDDAQSLFRSLELDVRAMQLADRRRTGVEAYVKRTEDEIKAERESTSTLAAATDMLRTAEYNTMLARANFLSDWAAFVSRVADDPVLNNLPSRYVRTTR